MIRVVVVDDHPVVRLGIRGLLESIGNIEVVGEVGSGEASIQLVRDTQPDIVLMDLNMPGTGGLTATYKLMRANPKWKVIIMTVRDTDPFPEHLIRAGASGYISKKSNLDELAKAIQKVMAGQIYISPEIAQRMALCRMSSSADSPFTQLSPLEMMVTLRVVRGQKPKDIAAAMHRSPKTVNTHRYRTFKKLAVRNDVELAHLALRYGLLEEAEKLPEPL